MGTAAQLLHVMDAHGTRYALIVGPNSGTPFKCCPIDATPAAAAKGIAVVRNDASRADLAALKDVGIVGVAWNVTHYGVDYYAGAAALLDRLRVLDFFVQVQVEHDQLVPLLPMLERSDVRILIDHCGRPTPAAGLDQPGFRALLGLAATRRAFVKLSGIVKFSREPFPHHDVQPYLDALLAAFTPDACMWASDWPFLRAPARVDYGVLLALLPQLIPDAAQRHKVPVADAGHAVPLHGVTSSVTTAAPSRSHACGAASLPATE
jgi:predicted TIM-barrel fold metal-dependent hydrolase